MLSLPKRLLWWFGRIWSRLTTGQRQSLVSLLILLIALPGGIYLTDKTQIFNPRGQEQPEVQTEPPKIYGYIVELKKDPVVKHKKQQEETGRSFITVDYQAELEKEHKEAKTDLLSRLGQGGVSIQEADSTLKVTNEFTTVFNGFALDIDQEQADKIKGSPLVKEVYPNYEVKTLLNDSVPLINADKVWELKDSQGRDVTGQGVRVAVIDTGVDYTHPDLGATQIQEREFEEVRSPKEGSYVGPIVFGDRNRIAYSADKKIYIYSFADNTLQEINYFNGVQNVDFKGIYKMALKGDWLVYYVYAFIEEGAGGYGTGALYLQNLQTNEEKKISSTTGIGTIFITDDDKIIYGAIDNDDVYNPRPPYLHHYDIAAGGGSSMSSLISSKLESIVAQVSGRKVVVISRDESKSSSNDCFGYEKLVVLDRDTGLTTDYFPPDVGPVIDFEGDEVLYQACKKGAYDPFWRTEYLYNLQTGNATKILYTNPVQTDIGESNFGGVINFEQVSPQISTYNFFNPFDAFIGKDIVYLYDRGIVAYDRNQNRYSRINLLEVARRLTAQEGKICFTPGGGAIYCHVYDPNYSYPLPDTIFNDKVVGGYNFVYEDDNPRDDHGHGTHVAAITASNGLLKGVAPSTQIIAYKVLDSSGNGSFSNVIAAIERAALTRLDTDLSNNIDIINMSLGLDCQQVGGYSPSCGPDDPQSKAVDNAVEAGVVVVVAAGNSGSNAGTVGSPGTARKAITVGAVDKNKQVASFSSRGPVSWDGGTLTKPDVVAPGVDICAAQFGQYADSERCIDNEHIAINGTSMAAPHVAGVVALLKQVHPDWTPQQIKDALMNTAVDLGYDANTQGTGLVDTLASINYLPNSTPPPTATTQSITLGDGWNLIGITVNKSPDYRASNFAEELNSSLGSNNVTEVITWKGGRYVVYTVGSDANNFPIVPGNGYWVRSSSGTATISGSGESLVSSLALPLGWSLISLPRLPAGITDAEGLLQAIQGQGIDAQQIIKWMGGRYIVHIIKNTAENFTLVPGQGYFIRNFGNAGTFTLPSVGATSVDLTSTIFGPANIRLGQTVSYEAKAQGQDLAWARIYWAKADSDLTKAESWTSVGGSDCSEGSTTCNATGNFTPPESGSYWLTAVANDRKLGPCSGNPKWDSVPGWKDCGPASRLSVQVSSRACIQVITPAKNDQTGECRDFSTLCDVPQGWTKVASCEATPSPTPTSSSPTGTISGPATGRVGQSLSYFGQGSGSDLKTISLHWARENSDLTRGESWHLIAKNQFECWTYAAAGVDCGADGTFTPLEAGTYYVTVVVVDNKDGPCSGNPRWDSVPGWKDCGQNDAILLNISQ